MMLPSAREPLAPRRRQPWWPHGLAVPNPHPLIQAGTCLLPPPPDFLLDGYVTPQVCKPVSEETHDIWSSLGPPWGKTVSALALHAAVCIMGTQLAVLCSKNHAAHGWQGGAAISGDTQHPPEPKAGPLGGILGGQGAGSRCLPVSLRGDMPPGEGPPVTGKTYGPSLTGRNCPGSAALFQIVFKIRAFSP